MCGRFTMAIDAQHLQMTLDLGEMPEPWEKRYNIAPSQYIPTVPFADTRHVVYMRWGLVPFWAQDPAIGNRMINARAETVAEKPSFRASFKNKRCLILADGFYEWQKGAKGSVPYYFTLKTREPFAFAGLWDDWEPKGVSSEPGIPGLTTCTLITTEANRVVAPIHPRMPVVLTKDLMWDWLRAETETEKLALLKPLDPDLMQTWQVGKEVNSPANDTEALIRPYTDLEQNDYKQGRLI